MNGPKFKGGEQTQDKKVGRPKSVLKAVNCGMNLREATIQIDTIIREMEAQGYHYKDHINISAGEKILIFIL
ncbi:MAG: hypothetical protein WAP53_07390 [Dysgonamonadaceae bacterium]